MKRAGRRLCVVGNWKLHGSKAMVQALIIDLQRLLIDVQGCEVVIAPPVIYLAQAQQLLGHNGPIVLGAQNVDCHMMGPFTGDISPQMLQEFSVRFVILGHSERRYHHQEQNEVIAKKFMLLQSVGLTPILCIGESAAERSAGKAEAVCAAQLGAIIDRVGAAALRDTLIAYEPLWAIGTGKAASPEQAQQMHHFIRYYIAQYDATIAQQLCIQYGGSVNECNAAQFFAMPDIDGALVGGAALQGESFSAIIKAAVVAKAH